MTEGVEDVAITGMGTIDGGGDRFVKEDLGTIFDPADWRPGLMHIRRCQRLRIINIALKNSANWTVHLLGCQDVVIRDITIQNSLKMPNCDGIDPIVVRMLLSAVVILCVLMTQLF